MTPATSHWMDSLQRRVEAQTARLSQENAASAPPPLIAPQSPLHELLIEEVAAALPAEVATRLRSSASVEEVHDWFAAGAIHRWLKHDAAMARRYLQELANRPREAGLALATTIAQSLDRPPPSREAVELDRWGAAFQYLAAMVLGLSRVAFFVLIVHALSGHAWSSVGVTRSLGEVITGRAAWLSPPLSLLLLFSICSWLYLECLYVPRALRYARRLPSEESGIRFESSWQLDSLTFYWSLQSLMLTLLLAGKGLLVISDQWAVLWQSRADGMSGISLALLMVCYVACEIAHVIGNVITKEP